MANQNSIQYAKAYVTEPRSKLLPQELNGRIRRIYSEITLDGEIDTTDSIFMAKLPANAVLIEARLIAPGGTSGVLQLGWGAGENEAADVDGIMAAIPANTAIDDTLSWADAGFNKRFSEEVDIILSATTISAAMTTELIQMELRYVID